MSGVEKPPVVGIDIVQATTAGAVYLAYRNRDTGDEKDSIIYINHEAALDAMRRNAVERQEWK